jgi:hypothetical protein
VDKRRITTFYTTWRFSNMCTSASVLAFWAKSPEIVHIMAYIDFLSTFLSTIPKSAQTKHVKLSHSPFSHAFT